MQALGVLFSSAPPGLRRLDHPDMGCQSDGRPTGMLRESQWQNDRVVSVYAVGSLSRSITNLNQQGTFADTFDSEHAD